VCMFSRKCVSIIFLKTPNPNDALSFLLDLNILLFVSDCAFPSLALFFSLFCCVHARRQNMIDPPWPRLLHCNYYYCNYYYCYDYYCWGCCCDGYFVKKYECTHKRTNNWKNRFGIRQGRSDSEQSRLPTSAAHRASCSYTTSLIEQRSCPSETGSRKSKWYLKEREREKEGVGRKRGSVLSILYSLVFTIYLLASSRLRQRLPFPSQSCCRCFVLYSFSLSLSSTQRAFRL
jgi:hypothetical protein